MRRGRLAKYEAGLVGWIVRQGTVEPLRFGASLDALKTLASWLR
jgi:hypothetical protein